jgi:hypothetical protein
MAVIDSQGCLVPVVLLGACSLPAHLSGQKGGVALSGQADRAHGRVQLERIN